MLRNALKEEKIQDMLPRANIMRKQRAGTCFGPVSPQREIFSIIKSNNCPYVGWIIQLIYNEHSELSMSMLFAQPQTQIQRARLEWAL